MQKTRQITLYITIIIWATIIGGIVYSHIVYFPPYLSHLPVSNQLIRGDYGLHDENFWMIMHPLAIFFTILSLVLNWKQKDRRRFILVTAGIYVLAILATATYFLPELLAFAKINSTDQVNTRELFDRGRTWQQRSWIRGVFMFAGFIMLLVALEKGKNQPGFK